MGAEMAFSAGSGLYPDAAMLPTDAWGSLIQAIERREALNTITPPSPMVAVLRAGAVNRA